MTAKCRICDGPIETFIDFGRMPLANAFLKPHEFGTEFFYHLAAAVCPRCTLVQLVDQPAPELMFNVRYPFFSASSARMTAHFERLALDVVAALAEPDPLIVEIGSNDGTLLRRLAEAGIRHVGVEPSASVAAAATARGITTMTRFFDRTAASDIARAHGRAHAVIAANALSHIADLHGVIAAIDELLAPNGIVVIEDPYWGDVMSRTAFDQIYDEHASYFSSSSLQALFSRHGMTVFDVAPVEVHGGSMRYFVSRTGVRPVSSRTSALLAQEQSSGLSSHTTLSAFRQRVLDTGQALISRLDHYQRHGMRVVGYGATSKSTTTINFFGVTSDLVEFIVDTTSAKHGTFSPGAHIPIRPSEAFSDPYPDRALLFLWNHAAEVRAKEQEFARRGGRWISYVPSVQES